MSSELEPRLKRALHDLPGPTRAAGERARTAALAVIPARPRSHGRRRLAVVAVAVAVVAALGAAALAATGRIHVKLGTSHPAAPVAPTPLVLPRGTHGVALVAGGRLWVAARGGARIEGWRATAAALSPGARYVAVGMGRSLIAMAPSGRPAWSHRTAGRVVAAAWRPDGLEIAYVVARRGRRGGAQSYLRRYAFGAGNLREVGSAGALSQLLATATPPIGRPVAVAQIAHGRLQLGVVAPPSMSHAQRL